MRNYPSDVNRARALLAWAVLAFSPSACLSSSSAEDLPLQLWIDGHVRSAGFVLFYGSNPEPMLEVVSPSGKIFKQQSTSGPPEVGYHNEPETGIKILTITKPEPGKWLALINGKPQLLDPTYDMSYDLDVENNLVLEGKMVYLPGKGIASVFTAALQDPEIPVSNLEVVSYYFTEEGDDKNHPLAFRKSDPADDWHANNAVFTSEAWEPTEFGTYDVVVVMKGLMEGHPFLRQADQTIPYFQKLEFDLELEPGKTYKATVLTASGPQLYSNFQVLRISPEGIVFAEMFGGLLDAERKSDVLPLEDLVSMHAQIEPTPELRRVGVPVRPEIEAPKRQGHQATKQVVLDNRPCRDGLMTEKSTDLKGGYSLTSAFELAPNRFTPNLRAAFGPYFGFAATIVLQGTFASNKYGNCEAHILADGKPVTTVKIGHDTLVADGRPPTETFEISLDAQAIRQLSAAMRIDFKVCQDEIEADHDFACALRRVALKTRHAEAWAACKNAAQNLAGPEATFPLFDDTFLARKDEPSFKLSSYYDLAGHGRRYWTCSIDYKDGIAQEPQVAALRREN